MKGWRCSACWRSTAWLGLGLGLGLGYGHRDEAVHQLGQRGARVALARERGGEGLVPRLQPQRRRQRERHDVARELRPRGLEQQRGAHLGVRVRVRGSGFGFGFGFGLGLGLGLGLALGLGLGLGLVSRSSPSSPSVGSR